jgi:hypothetical protein
MSKRGDCYDYEAKDSWNHSFMVEAVHGERFKTRTEAKHQVFVYIEVNDLYLWVQSQTTSSNIRGTLAQKHLKLKSHLVECLLIPDKINHRILKNVNGFTCFFNENSYH